MENYLERSRKDKLIIRLETNHPDQDKFDGIVLAHNKHFIALCSCEDFEFNGIIFIAKNHIVNFRNSDYESCQDKVVRHNGQINKLKTVNWISKVKTLYDILTEIKKENIWPSVEIITENESSYYIGPLIFVEKEIFKINCYDAVGEWESEYDLDISDIFKIEILDKYATHFNNYIQTF